MKLKKKKTNQENDKTIAIKIMRTKNGLKTRCKKIPRDEIEKKIIKNIKYINRANKSRGVKLDKKNQIQ
jgi:hypothetical protein